MLETIREYALEELQRNPSADELRAKHALYYVRMAEECAPRLRGPEQARLFAELEVEIADLRAALHHAAGHDSETLVRLTAALGYFWLVRGHINEARHWTELARRTGAGTPRMRAQTLRAAGRAALTQGAVDEACELFDEALVAGREERVQNHVGNILRNLAAIRVRGGDTAGARALFDEALEVSETHGDDWTAASVLVNLADLALTEARSRRRTRRGRRSPLPGARR